jgi:hypothetical protein
LAEATPTPAARRWRWWALTYNRGVAFANLGRRADALRDLQEAKRLDEEWTAQAGEIIARFRLKQQLPGPAK